MPRIKGIRTTVILYLSTIQKDKLKTESEKLGVSMNQVIRQFINKL